jgi:UDP-glucose 4-epimerase
MRVAVTGGAGFIGQAVVHELVLRGHRPVVVDRTLGGDITVPTTLPPGVDHVIHLAGVLGTDELFDKPRLAVDVNIVGTLNVLEWCRREGAGFTGITMPQVFPSVYTATKIAATRLASAWHHTHSLPVSHVRAFNAFGPGQKHGPGHPRKIIPAFSVEAWAQEPLIVWGDGTQTVDLIHTTDLARMLVDACDHGDDVTFDGGTGQAFSVNEVARIVNDIARSQAGVDHRPMRRGETPTHIVATGEGWERLTWRPKFSERDLIDTVYAYQPRLAAA